MCWRGLFRGVNAMAQITLKAKSSSGGDDYDVIFLLEDGVLFVACNCKAGIFGTACKHRMTLLSGDPKLLADPSQAKDLQTVAQWARDAGLETMLKELAEAEAQVAKAQRVVKKIKTTLGDGMNEGFGTSKGKP